MSLLFKNIGTIVGIDESGRTKVEGKAMAEIATLDNGWLLTEGNRICDYGPMATMPDEEGCEVVDVEGGWLFPSFCGYVTCYAPSKKNDKTYYFDL